MQLHSCSRFWSVGAVVDWQAVGLGENVSEHRKCMICSGGRVRCGKFCRNLPRARWIVCMFVTARSSTVQDDVQWSRAGMHVYVYDTTVCVCVYVCMCVCVYVSCVCECVFNRVFEKETRFHVGEHVWVCLFSNLHMHTFLKGNEFVCYSMCAFACSTKHTCFDILVGESVFAFVSIDHPIENEKVHCDTDERVASR